MTGLTAVPELLRGRQLVIVSNREPYVHQRGRHGIEVERPAGGLIAALDPVLRDVPGVWVAWGSGDADFDVVDARDCVPVPPDDPRYVLRRVRISEEEVEQFYHGFANQTLWPLFHLAVDKARFVRRYWAAYQAVNRRFAQATMDMLAPGAVVWMQDYHLALCPRYLREQRPDLFLMHFWHIPWPGRDVFRICPQRAELLEGLLANDLLGFHLSRHVANFLDCVEHELGATIDRQHNTVEYRGHRTLVQAFPISIDVGAWERIAGSRACERWMARLRQRFGLHDRLVGVGVDRLDYTKGILERLRAIELFFRRYPGFRGRFVYIQKAAPSRTRIAAYRHLQHQVEAAIARTNAAYATEDWQPIIYIPRPIPAAGMAALYRMADVCLVTSLQDGMNLVAKEFVASQQDERGVLILSELAGAYKEAPWSVAINPFDPEGVADALKQALTMPPLERQRRMAHMRAHLARHDVYHWMEQHLRATAHLLDAMNRTPSVFEHLEPIRRSVNFRGGLAILLDFDGTLVPIADHPDVVRLTARAQSLLARLHQVPWCQVAVISGRALEDVRRCVDLNGIIYAGNHGYELAGPGWTWVHEDAAEARDLVAACCQRIWRRLRDVRGALVENKGITATVHYRLVAREHVASVQRIVLEELSRLPPGRLEILHGKMAFELRPALEWDKGKAVCWLLERVLGQNWRETCTVVYAGDDATDEDAFVALADAAITVKIGPDATAARYRVRDVKEMARLLEVLVGWVESYAFSRTAPNVSAVTT